MKIAIAYRLMMDFNNTNIEIWLLKIIVSKGTIFTCLIRETRWQT